MISGTNKQVTISFIERFIHSVQCYPEKVALIFENQHLTYKELYQKVISCANMISNYTNSSNRVLLYLPRGISLIVGMIACQYLGVPYIPLNYSIPDARFNHILSLLGNGIILSEEDLSAKTTINVNKHFNCINIRSCDVNIVASSNTTMPVALTDEAYYIFTSGTTGQPKAVMVGTNNCNNLLDFFSNILNCNSSTTILSSTSPGFDIFFLEYTLALANGGQLLLLSDTQAASAQVVAQLLMEYVPTIYQATPSLLKCLLPYLSTTYKFDSLLVGGEYLGKFLSSTLQHKSKTTYNVYGPTETTVWSTVQQLQQPNEQRIGVPLQNTYIKVVDDNGEQLKKNLHGRILIGGDGVTIGYFNDPILTSRKFTVDTVDKIRWYDTGDIGYIDSDNILNFVTRNEDFVKVNGFRVDLLEISNVLETLDFVLEAAVICERDEHETDQIRAFIKLASDTNIVNVENIALNHLREHLFNYMLPSSIVIVDEFPRNSNGKLDLKSLRSYDNKNSANADSMNTTQSKVLAILANYMNTKTLGAKDNFFNYGLTSMHAISLHLDLSKHWPQLELFHLFEASNLESLTKVLEESN